MKVAELFSGTEHIADAFRERGHEVFTIDRNDKGHFNPSMEADILDITAEDFPEEKYDVIWASPPCNKFCVPAIHGNWTEDNKPKNPDAAKAVHIIYHTLYLINALQPTYWFIENPCAKLRRIIGVPPENNDLTEADRLKGKYYSPHGGGTVTYCQYGAKTQKRTDLWGTHPPSFEYRVCSHGDDCHEAAPRGTRDYGIQGMAGTKERAAIPEGLAKEVAESCINPGKNQQRSLSQLI